MVPAHNCERYFSFSFQIVLFSPKEVRFEDVARFIASMLQEVGEIEKLKFVLGLKVQGYKLTTNGPTGNWIVVAASEPGTLRINSCQIFFMMQNPLLPLIRFCH